MKVTQKHLNQGRRGSRVSPQHTALLCGREVIQICRLSGSSFAGSTPILS